MTEITDNNGENEDGSGGNEAQAETQALEDAGPEQVALQVPEVNDEDSGDESETLAEESGTESNDSETEEAPAPGFAKLGLRNSVLRGLHDCGFRDPTDIQANLIPAALTGKDMLGQAKTGTGKTAAFGLPLIHMADKDVMMQALILAPTRELAAQVAMELDKYAKYTPIRCVCITGGGSMKQQVRTLNDGQGHIMVGTPGRVMDLHGRGLIHFKHMKFMVLDEVDRMLDIGFRDDIKKILDKCPKERQTIFVSATIAGEIERLARRFMKKDVQKIVTTEGALTVARVAQHSIAVEPWDKKRMLHYIFKHEKPMTTIVFCRTKQSVDYVTKYLRDKKIDVRAIHGDMAQGKRNRVIKSLRDNKMDVLVATDLAARGLDVDHITHVINYDLPEDPDVYVHRIGRTARAGRNGVAWSFCTSEQGKLITQIEKLIGLEIPPLKYEEFEPGPVPEDVQKERDRQEAIRNANPMDVMTRRAQGPVDTEGLSEAELNAMFPGGVIPKGANAKGLGKKFKTKRRR